MNRVLLAVVAVAFFLVDVTYAQPVNLFNPYKNPLARMEMQALISGLLDSVNPDLPINSYMPEFLKEKMRPVVRESNLQLKRSGSPILNLVADETGAMGAKLMRANYVNSLPRIEIFADKWFYLVRIRDGVAVGHSQLHKNSFAVCLAHELVHLELPPEGFQKERVLIEEFRAWSKIDKEVVSPLLAVGQPLERTFENVHRILVGCNYKLPCEAFIKLGNVQ